MEISITKPDFDEGDLEALRGPLERGWVGQGPCVEAFEQAFAAYVGCSDAVAVSSGTAALHLALTALAIGPGDEVIVPSFTWVATANAVVYCGATPVFCDIQPGTFNIDPDAVEALITPRTRAIIPVHLFGLSADLGAIIALAQKYHLVVIEDAACALGTTYRHRHVGLMSPCATFSFHPRKVITTGEGGMITTNDSLLAARLRSLRNHGGFEKSPTSDGSAIEAYGALGFNYRLSDLQGALGVRQLGKLPKMLAARARRADRYNRKLANLTQIATPADRESPLESGTVHAYQAYVCRYQPEDVDLRAPGEEEIEALTMRRDMIIAALARNGIAAQPGTLAVHDLPYYRRHYASDPKALIKTRLARAQSLALPIFPQLTNAEQDHVILHLKCAIL